MLFGIPPQVFLSIASFDSIPWNSVTEISTYVDDVGFDNFTFGVMIGGDQFG